MTLRARLVTWLLIAAVAVPVAWIARPWLDNPLLDRQFRVLREAFGPLPVDDDPLLVGIDENTFEAYEWPLGLWHPYFGAFLDAMAQAPARLVILDVIMPQKPVPDTLVRLADEGHLDYHDDPFLRALLNLDNIGVSVVFAEAPDETGSRLLRGYSEFLSTLGSRGDLDHRFGYVQLSQDADGVFRRYHEKVGEQVTLAARASVILGVPVGDGLLDFRLGDDLDYVPMQEVTALVDAGDADGITERFAGRIVFLGAVTTTQDRKRLPLRLFRPGEDSRGAYQPGVVVHLQALRSYLAGGLVDEAKPWMLGASWLAALGLFWSAAKIGRLMLLLAAFGVVVLAGSTATLAVGLALPAGSTLVLALAATGGRYGLESLAAFRDRRRLRASFSGYVSPSVLDSILVGGIRPQRGGQRYHACVFFSDIRSFTTRSEKQAPEEIISLLNRYFEDMVDCIHSHRGTVDKFIGDGLMAFFGAPNVMERPGAAAFAASAEMLARLAVLNEKLEAEGIEPIRIGIGLHTGDVVVGHVGSSDRHEYTAIGDTVNVAARLEGLTKTLGCEVAMSESVCLELDAGVVVENMGSQSLKGREDMTVYGYRRDAEVGT